MGARELWTTLVGAGFSVTIDGDGLLVKPASKLSDTWRAEIRANKAEVMELIKATTQDPDRWCWPHGPAMNGAEIDTHLARLARFKAEGMADHQAEAKADQMTLEDRQRAKP